MSNPNRTVYKYRRKAGFATKPQRPAEPWFDWVCAQARAGVVYQTIDEAKAAYAAATTSQEQSQ